ncbi:unnamed protein product [Protopolystoma xenopodis]|uniref:Uncharacterized protein n=1 Tax=Protopolystoma xenopodis TaxID=117903 RepID=A0A3S5CS99_9PLAT|nr:unnamed protein product [Protopolystoma xenopodis]
MGNRPASNTRRSTCTIGRQVPRNEMGQQEVNNLTECRLPRVAKVQPSEVVFVRFSHLLCWTGPSAGLFAAAPKVLTTDHPNSLPLSLSLALSLYHSISLSISL